LDCLVNNIDLPIFTTFFPSSDIFGNGLTMTSQISLGSKLTFDFLLFGILTLALKMRLWKGNFDTKNFFPINKWPNEKLSSLKVNKHGFEFWW